MTQSFSAPLFFNANVLGNVLSGPKFPMSPTDTRLLPFCSVGMMGTQDHHHMQLRSLGLRKRSGKSGPFP